MKITNLEQGSEAWHEFRKNHIGASEISMIMGSNPWKSAYELWLEKTDKVKPKGANKAMQRGSLMEEEALHEFIAQSKRFYEPKVGVFSKWHTASASFDGLSEDETHIVEIKCPGSKSYDDMLENGIPLYYRHQVEWQLMISKAEKADFFVYASENLNFSYSVFPDKEMQDEMLVKAKAFWDCVQNDKRPELSDDDYELIDDDYEFSKLANQYLEIDEQIKELESLRKAFKDSLIDYIGKGNAKGYGIKIGSRSGRKTLNLEKLCFDYGIDQESLEKYYRIGTSYTTITKSSDS